MYYGTTEYSCGETLNLDDLTVTYYNAHGEQSTLTDQQYTTNATELDLNHTGKQTLIVRYEQTAGETPLEACVELDITGKAAVVISGITMENTVYDAERVSYQGTAVVTDKVTGEPIDIPLIYSYKGELIDGTPYTEIEKPPIDAGEYTLVVAVAQDNALYTGICELNFAISKAPITITADNVVVVKGSEPPQTPEYTYNVQGLIKEDQRCH